MNSTITDSRRIVATTLSLLTAGSLFAATQPADSQKDLRLFYQQNCARCHGADGSGRNAEGKPLKGRDLIDTEWQKKTSDQQMVKVILKGKFFGLAMPGFSDTLTREEALRMVTEVIRKGKKNQPIGPVNP